MCLRADDDSTANKKTLEQNNKLKLDLAAAMHELGLVRAKLEHSEKELASALARIEITSAAAIGQFKELMAEKVNEAYKEGQRDAQRFLKEMRSMF